MGSTVVMVAEGSAVDAQDTYPTRL